MNSCLQNCKPGDILVWMGVVHNVVCAVTQDLVLATNHRGVTTRFCSDDVRHKLITKIIKKTLNK